MPNWCSNRLTATGTPRRLEALRRHVSSPDGAEPFSLTSVVRQPPSVGDSWWGWRLTWWGTKWDLSSVRFRTTDGAVEWDFSSANSPPVAAVALLSFDFPDITFELDFSEPSNDIGGRVTFLGGRVVAEVNVSEVYETDEDGEVVDDAEPQIVETPVDIDTVRDTIAATLEAEPAARREGVLLTAILRAAPADRVWHFLDLLVADVDPAALVRRACEQVLAGRPVPLVPVLLHHDDDAVRRAGAALFGLSPLLVAPDPFRTLLGAAPGGDVPSELGELVSGGLRGKTTEPAPPVSVDELVELVSGSGLTAQTVEALAPDWTGQITDLLEAVQQLAAGRGAAF